MKIYTRTGDDGQTGLLGGPRVGKDDPIIEALGCVDELNAQIGKLVLLTSSAEVESLHQIGPQLEQRQHELFEIGAQLADVRPDQTPLGLDSCIQLLEQQIDQWEESLPTLKQFILPGGTPLSVESHGTRCLCRRAERRVVEGRQLQDAESPDRFDSIIRYLNRLSDYFFVFARFANQQSDVPDTPWRGLPN